MADNKIVFDCSTGVAASVPLSDAEQAAKDALAAAWVATQQARADAKSETTAASSDLATQYATTLAQLEQIRTAGSMSNAQLLSAVQVLATIQERLMRLMRDALT